MSFFYLIRFLAFSLLSVFSSCSLFEQKVVGSDLNKEIPKVCLSSEGQGRLMISDHKFVFKFFSGADADEQQWYMSLVFPLYGEETFVVDWRGGELQSFEASFEQKILKSRDKVDPEKLHAFLEKWARLIVEINKLKSSKESTQSNGSDFSWSSSKKLLRATSIISEEDFLKLEFKNLTSGNYFGRYDVFMQSRDNKSIKLELIVRKCLEKPE